MRQMIPKLFCRVFLVGLLLSGVAFAEPVATKTLQQLKDDAAKQAETPMPSYQNGRAVLAAPFQAMEALVTADGLSLRSLATGEEGQFQLKPVAFGKTQRVEVARGAVAIVGNQIHLRRHGISEIFSSSMDGIRQDFLVHQRPSGHGELHLELAVEGADVSGHGQQVKLTTAAGRELVYHNLHITDANGKVLNGKISAVNNRTLHISVDDRDAHYPLLIDPTYTDADWQVLNEGLPGADGAVNALVVWNNALYIGGASQPSAKCRPIVSPVGMVATGRR